MNVENKYRSLNNSLVLFNSVLFIRITAGFGLLITIWLLISLLNQKENLISIIGLATVVTPFFFVFHIFSSIIYSTSDIKIQNIYGKKVFKKVNFVTIRPWTPYLNLYIIEFTDNQSFLFGVGSLASSFHDNNKTATYLTNKLLNE